MAVGQTLADILGGLVAINRGDPSGAQAFTKQGRADLAQQRGNQRGQQDILGQVLQKAQSDPKFNAMLQQAMQPYLANEQMRAQTAGQQSQNVRSDNVNQFFGKYGGSPESANFGLQKGMNEAQIGQLGANTRQTDLQTDLMVPEFQTRMALNNAQIGNIGANTERTQGATNKEYLDYVTQFQNELSANMAGFPSYDASQVAAKQTLAQKQLALQEKQGNQQAASGIFDRLLPDYQTGGLSSDQRFAAGQAGVNFPPDQEAARRQQLAQQAMGAIRDMRGEKQTRSQRKASEPQAQPAPMPTQQQPTQPLRKLMANQSAGQAMDSMLWPAAPGQEQGPTLLAKMLDAFLGAVAPQATDNPEIQPLPQYNLDKALKILQQLGGGQ